MAGLAVLVLFLVGLNLRTAILLRRSRMENEVRSLDGKNDDEDVLALLEAHAATSALAARLLPAARDESSKVPLLTSGEKQERPRQWEFIWEQFGLEITDEARLQAITCYAQTGIDFSDYEKTQFLIAITDSNCRDSVRQLLYPPKRESVGGDSSSFRWSKQNFTMLCTMSCRCGKRAHILSGPQLHLQCGCRKTTITTGITLTKRMLYINPDGVAWRCTEDGELIKAEID